MRYLLRSIVLALTALTTVVDAAEPATLTGQVVCSECWSEADRATVAYGTEADLECAARCAAKGIPPALAVKRADGFELIRLEGKQDWPALTGRFVRARGTLHDHAGTAALLVDSIDRLDASPWVAAAATAPIWTDLGGHRQTLDEYSGRIVVLNFWATWCEPCRDEMPDLVRIQNEYGMYGVQVLGASADPVDSGRHVAAFARRLKVNFPVLLGATTDQMQALGVGVALPATVVLDRDGSVVERIPGVVTRRRLAAVLEPLIDDGGAPRTTSARTDRGHGHRHGRPGDGTQASLVPS